MDQEEKINWDKLLNHLKHSAELPDDDELNPEELEMLLFAEEINMRLKEEDVQLRFPVHEGWIELQERYQQKMAKARRFKLYRVLALAAVLVVALSTTWWLFLQQNHTEQQIAGNQIQLTLANGQTVELDSSQSEILKTEGAALNGTSLVYKPETALPKGDHQSSLNVLSVPKGKFTRLELSDGTKIWINSGSKLSYPVPFAANKREVTLEGEAYFDVSHNADRPFVVHAKSVAVKVLGTAFGMSTFKNQVSTALEKGKVSMQAGNQQVLLVPGELGLYHAENNSLTKSEADLRIYTAWKDLDLYFSESTLEEITSRIAREYDVDFVFEQENLKNLHFTIDMPKHAALSKILQNIKLSSDEVDFEIKGNQIQVKRR